MFSHITSRNYYSTCIQFNDNIIHIADSYHTNYEQESTQLFNILLDNKINRLIISGHSCQDYLLEIRAYRRIGTNN